MGTHPSLHQQQEREQFNNRSSNLSTWAAKVPLLPCMHGRTPARYAYLMETPTLEFKVESLCGLKQVGEEISEKGYGIAMRLKEDYKIHLDETILQLKEKGEVTLH